MMAHQPMDLRGLPVWERAAAVLERIDGLAAGEWFDFRTEIDPRALLTRLEELRPDELSLTHRCVGENEWRVTLRRLSSPNGAPPISRVFERSAIFAKLGDNARALAMESMTEHTVRKGDVVCDENAECGQLSIVLEGMLAVFAGAGTRERMLYALFPFDVLGDVEFFDGGLAVGRSIAISKTARYASMPHSVLREIGMREPAFLIALGAATAQRNRTLASALAAQVSKPILARVATALLPYAPPERGLRAALAPLPQMTQAQVAAAAGTVKEVAARAIAELERMDVLRRERGHIRYLDRSKILETIET